MAEDSRLSAEQLARLIRAADLSTPTGIRNAAMIVLMATGGLKVGELVGKETGTAVIGGLRLADIDWTSRSLRVRRPAAADQRTVALPVEAVQMLKAWVDLRPASPDDLVFVTRRGTRIMNRYVRRFLREYGRAAGIEIAVKPSMLRRTFGARVYAQTGDLRSVAETLGLRHLASSVRYAAPPDANPSPESTAGNDGPDA